MMHRTDHLKEDDSLPVVVDVVVPSDGVVEQSHEAGECDEKEPDRGQRVGHADLYGCALWNGCLADSNQGHIMDHYCTDGQLIIF